MGIVGALQHWFQQRRDRKAKALPNGYSDLVGLYKAGLVFAKGTGQSITNISAEVTSRVNVPLKVSVAHGTYFVSSGNHQNMVTRRKYEFELWPLGTERINVPATCINASLPIPKESDRFKGGIPRSNKRQPLYGSCGGRGRNGDPGGGLGADGWLFPSADSKDPAHAPGPLWRTARTG